MKQQTHSTTAVSDSVLLIENKRKCIICRKEFYIKKYGRKDAKCCSSIHNSRWWYRHNKERALKYQKQYLSIDKNKTQRNLTRRIPDAKRRLELRKKVIEKLGSKCIKCGFSDWRALQVDHIHGGGRQDLYQNFNRDREKYYRFLLKTFSNKYQLLCSNCNWIKKYENYEVNHL